MKSKMKTGQLIMAVLLIFSLTTGCSVFMAANQPEKRDIHVLDRGTPRNQVIAELGAPAHSKVEEGKTCDIFLFVQGYGTGAKVGRAVFHGVADVITLGLWEVVGTPIEVVADGTEVKVEVFYDATECVEKVNVIRGEDVMKGVNSISNAPEKHKSINPNKQ
jgi:hypothetical protein